MGLELFLASDLADISSNLRIFEIIVFYFDIYFKSCFSFAINIYFKHV